MAKRQTRRTVEDEDVQDSAVGMLDGDDAVGELPVIPIAGPAHTAVVDEPIDLDETALSRQRNGWNPPPLPDDDPQGIADLLMSSVNHAPPSAAEVREVTWRVEFELSQIRKGRIGGQHVEDARKQGPAIEAAREQLLSFRPSARRRYALWFRREFDGLADAMTATSELVRKHARDERRFALTPESADQLQAGRNFLETYRSAREVGIRLASELGAELVPAPAARLRDSLVAALSAIGPAAAIDTLPTADRARIAELVESLRGKLDALVAAIGSKEWHEIEGLGARLGRGDA